MPYPGQPKDTPIPPELDRWNWGAFFLNWIWGLGNSTYIALLMFVPFVNFVMVFVLGAKGSQWAWKNRLWENEAHFRRTQRNWGIAGLAVFVTAALLVTMMATSLPAMFKNSGAYKESMALLRANPAAVAILGEPVETGFWVNGQINLNGDSGTANMSIPVSGPRCSGHLISHATKANGEWDIYLLVLESDCGAERLVLVNSHNIAIPNAGPASENI